MRKTVIFHWGWMKLNWEYWRSSTQCFHNLIILVINIPAALFRASLVLLLGFFFIHVFCIHSFGVIKNKSSTQPGLLARRSDCTLPIVRQFLHAGQLGLCAWQMGWSPNIKEIIANTLRCCYANISCVKKTQVCSQMVRLKREGFLCSGWHKQWLGLFLQ